MPHKDPEARRAYKKAYSQREKRLAYERTPARRAAKNSASQQWKDRNPEACQLRQKAYSEAHKESIAVYQEHYRATHKESSKSYQRAYYATHKSSQAVKNRAYRLANKVKLAIKARARGQKNKEVNQAKNRAYRKTHQQTILANNARRRARKAAAPCNDFTAAQWLMIQATQNHRCAYCGKRCKGRLTQDHILALSKGGAHTLQNIIGACGSCNSRKRTGPPLVPVQPLLL